MNEPYLQLAAFAIGWGFSRALVVALGIRLEILRARYAKLAVQGLTFNTLQAMGASGIVTVQGLPLSAGLKALGVYGFVLTPGHTVVVRGESPTACPMCGGRALSTAARWACARCGVAGRVVA